MVIVIMLILIMMLMPALAGAWQAVYVTQCRTNLYTIYQAMVLWQQDKNSVVFSQGPGWNASLLPYVENRTDVFLCPASSGPLDTPCRHGDADLGGRRGRRRRRRGHGQWVKFQRAAAGAPRLRHLL